jgi:hypothetical protein
MWEDCDRACVGCCNDDWDLKGLPVCNDFTPYDTVMLTGGEPMLDPKRVVSIASVIMFDSNAKVIVYTARASAPDDLLLVLCHVHGITLTLHEQSDVDDFITFERRRIEYFPESNDRSLRLNVFKGIDISAAPTEHWQVKDNIEWIKDCPLPDGEVLMRL